MRGAPTRWLRSPLLCANKRRRASRERERVRASTPDRRPRAGPVTPRALRHARLRERTSIFSPQARRRRRAGWRGLPSRDVGSGEERRRTGLPREAGRGARGALCAGPQEQTCYAPTSRRSPVRRAPQRSRAKAAGRSRPRTSSRDGNPRRPASPRSPSAATRRQTASQLSEAPAPQARHGTQAETNGQRRTLRLHAGWRDRQSYAR